jgi:hypothetical protein
MKCLTCDTQLTGGTDTFGDVGQELCMECWYALCAEMRVTEHWRSWADTFSLVTDLDEQIAKQVAEDCNP